MEILLWILASTFLISLIALIGVFSLYVREELLNKILCCLVSLSAGALLGGAFLHLMPEASRLIGIEVVSYIVLVGFCIFFLVEKLLFWRHCHKAKCPVHTFTIMNLIGDAVHNFIDGLIIAASFLVSIHLGITTSIAVALHEIPQELGDFGVLVYGGFKKQTALKLNFIVALTAVIGGVVGFVAYSYVKDLIVLLLPFAAGGFIYIAASDLVPELVREKSTKKSVLNFFIFLLGILVMFLLKLLH